MQNNDSCNRALEGDKTNTNTNLYNQTHCNVNILNTIEQNIKKQKKKSKIEKKKDHRTTKVIN